MARRKKPQTEEQMPVERRQPVADAFDIDNSQDNELGMGFDSMLGEMPEDQTSVRDADGMVVTFDPDGGATVDFGDDAEDSSKPPEMEFDDNLAEMLTETERLSLGIELKDLVEADLRSRTNWTSRMRDGLQIIGLADIPETETAFLGAARVTHPGLAEAIVQFEARAMDELMPPEGPVKCGVLGKSSAEMEERAERVQTYMNRQLMVEDRSYYPETESMLIYLPYAGSAFRKVAIDPVTNRSRAQFVRASDFIVPDWATSLEDAPRYTHRYRMPLNKFKRAVANDYFIEADFSGINSQMLSTDDDTTKELREASDKTTSSYHDTDVDLSFYEITIDRTFDWDKEATNDVKYDVPYTITFEWETCRVVRIARCWKETDLKCQKDVWWTHYKFLPGLGFYGWGYLHLIGGLGVAASGALRLLLDGSATSSLQGGFKSREAKQAGTTTFEPGVWQDVDMAAEELAKAFYTPPFKEPSPALFKTLEILINAIQRFASTTEQMVGDASAQNAPVGTTLALIEQGSKLFSGIHKRLHQAQGCEFRQLRDCNYRFMEEDRYPFETGDGNTAEVFRADFAPSTPVEPVSDPNIFSNVQRIAVAQAGVAMVNEAPDLFDRRTRKKAYRGLIKALKLPDGDDWLPEKDFYRLDPVSENVAVMNGVGIRVFPEQDDEAHNALHQMFKMELANSGMDPALLQKAMASLDAHIAAHFASAYRKRMSIVMSQAHGVPLPPFDPTEPEKTEELPPELEVAVSQALVQVVPPPPPPAPSPEGDPEAAKDMEAARKADREDMLAQRKMEREDEMHIATLKRKGLISDTPSSSGELPPEASV